MAKQTFTVGQVLTAAQLTSLQQTAMGGGAASAKTASYTLVAADAGTTISMTSTSATTVTVNTGLFAAGDTVFIQNLGSGNLTITAGTATVATAGSLILPQNDAGILYFVSTSSSVFYDFIQVGAASPLTTKGDLYTFSTSDTRLGVGADGTTIVADSAEATGLKWATASSGGMTLISTTTLSGATTTLSSIPQTYQSLYLIVTGVTYNTSNKGFRLSPNDVTNLSNWLGVRTTEVASGDSQTMYLSTGTDTLRTDADNIWTIQIDNYTSSTRYKTFNWVGSFLNISSVRINNFIGGVFRSNTAISSLVFDVERTNTFAGGTVLLYGVK